MTTINVRLSEEEKRNLEEYGKISDVVRDAIRMYINNKKSARALQKLKEYQRKTPVAVSSKEIVANIRKDRDSR